MPEDFSAPGCRRAVFLDRDGTINRETQYLHRIDEFHFLPGVPEALARLNAAGFLLLVVTNQSGVARGYYDMEAVDRLHRHIDSELNPYGARIDGWFVCPHHPDFGLNGQGSRCDCRKPRPGMLLQAACQFGVDLSRSFMVGDKVADVLAAQAAGCTPILVRTGYGADAQLQVPSTVVVADDLAGAVDHMLSLRAETSVGEEGSKAL